VSASSSDTPASASDSDSDSDDKEFKDDDDDPKIRLQNEISIQIKSMPIPHTSDSLVHSTYWDNVTEDVMEDHVLIIESGNDEYERRIQEAKACLASAVETNKIGEKLKEEIEGLVVLDKESSNKCKKEKPDAAVDDLTFLDKKLTIPGTE
jgi:hypothetical protein